MTEEALDHRDSASVELHNSLYDRAITLLKPYLGSAGSRDDAAVGDVRRGCELLERVLELNPGNWSAAWVDGQRVEGHWGGRVGICGVRHSVRD